MNLRRFLLWWRGGFGFFGELREGGGSTHGEIRQDLAIERHTGDFETVDQLPVSQAVLTRGRADALYPETAIIALFGAAIAKGITIGAIGSFLSGLGQLAFGQE